jgi:hypothetical protein
LQRTNYLSGGGVPSQSQGKLPNTIFEFPEAEIAIVAASVGYVQVKAVSFVILIWQPIDYARFSIRQRHLQEHLAERPF